MHLVPSFSVCPRKIVDYAHSVLSGFSFDVFFLPGGCRFSAGCSLAPSSARKQSARHGFFTSLVYALSSPAAASVWMQVWEHPGRLDAPRYAESVVGVCKTSLVTIPLWRYGTGFLREGQGGLLCSCQRIPLFVGVVCFFAEQFFGRVICSLANTLVNLLVPPAIFSLESRCSTESLI